MARSDILLVLAGCLLLASVCLVQAVDRPENLQFEIFEHESSENELDVFGPQPSQRLSSDRDDRDDNRGRGILYSNRVTKEEDRESKHIADISGLYFYIKNNQVEKVSTVNFRENANINQDRRFANAQLHLSGVWRTGRGQERRNQELSIVGGTEGLAGARGVVRYERLEKNTYRVTGDIQIRRQSQSLY